MRKNKITNAYIMIFIIIFGLMFSQESLANIQSNNDKLYPSAKSIKQKISIGDLYSRIELPTFALSYYDEAYSQAVLTRSNTLLRIASFKLAKTLLWLNQNKEAKKIYQNLLSSDLNADDKVIAERGLRKIEKIELGNRLQLAINFIKQEQGLKAYNILKKYIKHPSYRLSYVLGQSFAMQEKPNEALKYFKKSFELSQTNRQKITALYGVAKMEYWLGNKKNAETVIVKMKQIALESESQSLLNFYLSKLTAIKLKLHRGKNPQETIVGKIRKAIFLDMPIKAKSLLKKYPNKKSFFYYKSMGDVFFLLEDPRLSKLYYQAAYKKALNQDERKAALFGQGRTALWLEEYSLSLKTYFTLDSYPLSKNDQEVVTTGLVISITNLDFPLKAYLLVKKRYPNLIFQYPLSVIAATKAAIFYGWAYKAKAILARNQTALDKIPEGNYLQKQLREVNWLILQQTSPAAMGTNYYTVKDSDEFRIIRKSMYYSERTLGINSNTIFELGQNSYTFNMDNIDANIFSITQRFLNIGDRLNVNLRGAIASVNYNTPAQATWHPFLWRTDFTFRLSDTWLFSAYNSQEYVEATPAINNKILFNTSEGTVLFHPFSRVFYRWSVFHNEFNDNNTRNGSSMALTYMLMRQVAFLVELRYRFYKNTQPNSPFYFSPPKLDEKSIHLIFKRRISPTWRVYAEGGIGRQALLPTLFDPRVSQQTLNFDLNIIGALTDNLQMNVIFGYSQNAFNNFVGAFSRTYFAINFKLLLT